MSSAKLTVYIDTNQLEAQKNNNYSLFLAKKVNDDFTVIWQSKGPKAKVHQPSYEYHNEFDLSIPSFMVNYANATENFDAGSSFTSGGKSKSIELGQTVELDDDGIFTAPKNDGNKGTITIHNQLQGNPHEILQDEKGNNIFVNRTSGMDIGPAVLIPKDSYQIWFGNYQETGTIIADNRSTVKTVTLEGKSSKTISYNADGNWIDGELPPNWVLSLSDGSTQTLNQLAKGTDVIVFATFTVALTAGAVSYLANKLINKFTDNLKPSRVVVAQGNNSVIIEFSNTAVLLALAGTDHYENAVDSALQKAKADPNSDLNKQTWTITDIQVAVQSQIL